MANINANTTISNEFWHKKVKFYFGEILDIDKDGKLNSKDLTHFKEFYRIVKGYQPGSIDLEKFNKFLNKWIGSMLVMINKQKPNNVDVFVTLEEFNLYSERLRAELNGKKAFPPALAYMNDYVDALFNILDIDNDGTINRKDFLTNSSNVEDLRSREKSWSIMVERLGMTRIDRRQFNDLFLEFLTSTDPKDRGNYVFGYFE